LTSRHKHSHLKRYRHLAEILARHGLGYFSSVLALERFVPLRQNSKNHSANSNVDSRPEHVRLAIEEIGASAIKLGQILSTRADLVPPEYQVELAKLQDAAPPVPAAEIKAVITSELGLPIEEIFLCFQDEPIAAASIGVAHAATLFDGTEVVVKVRRPGVVAQIEEDLEILEDLALAASRRWDVAEQYDVAGLANDFAERLRHELDYVREGHSAERIAANFKGDRWIHIPRIYWEQSSGRVLTMERARGIKIDDMAALEAAGIDRRELAARAANIILKMVFEDGFFHADPHPGNLFIQPDGSITFIDFGMVGMVDEATRTRIVHLLEASLSRDPDRLVDAFLDLGAVRQHVDRNALRRDLQRLVEKYTDSTLKDVNIAVFLNESLAIVRRYHVQMPNSLALILKMGVMVEGIGVQLDPDFNLTEAIKPHCERLMRERYSPMAIAKRFGQASLDAIDLGTEFPVHLRRILKEMERGNLETGVRPVGFEPLMERLEGLTNRIVLGLLAAAFIVSLAVLMTIYRPPGWQQWAGFVFSTGFIIAAALGIILAWGIVRTKRR